MALSADFLDDVLDDSMDGSRRYKMTETTNDNGDKIVTLEDATTYAQLGSDFGAKELNEICGAINDNETNITALSTTVNSILLKAYPVGSIYMSVNSTNPSTLFGGTWEQLQDRFLVGTGSSYSNGATGGATTHTLTKDNLPAHTHSTPNHTHTISVASKTITGWFNPLIWEDVYADGTVFSKKTSGTQKVNKTASSGSDFGRRDVTINATHTHSLSQTSSGGGTSGSTGSGTAVSNLPPYLAVYMWKRTA